MPLDPQMATLLAATQSQVAPDFQRLTAAQLRQSFSGTRLPTELTPAIHHVFDQEIDGPGGPIPLRIYQPAATAPLPILVYFHGGGFVLGDLDSHDNLCRALCNALPAVVVAVDYRLAPEHKFPAGPDDAFTATEWVARNADALGGDRSKLLVGGDSAGGNLAAVVCQQARDVGGPAIAHQVLLYPVCDNDLQRSSYHEVGKGYLLETEMMGWFWQQYLNSPDDGALAKACPLKGNKVALPSATVITAAYDPLRDEGQAYAQQLEQAGVSVRQLCVPGAIHGFMSFVGLVALADTTLVWVADSVNNALNA